MRQVPLIVVIVFFPFLKVCCSISFASSSTYLYVKIYISACLHYVQLMRVGLVANQAKLVRGASAGISDSVKLPANRSCSGWLLPRNPVYTCTIVLPPRNLVNVIFPAASSQLGSILSGGPPMSSNLTDPVNAPCSPTCRVRIPKEPLAL